MKKLLIIDPADSFGGAEKYALTMCNAVMRRGWSVEVAFNGSKPMGPLADALSNMGAICHHTELEMHDSNLKSMPAQLKMARRTLALLKRTNPDIALVILPWPGYGLGMVCALSILNIPGLIVFQLVPAANMKYRWPVTWLYRWSHRRSQAWIAVSESNRTVLSDSFGIPTSEIEVIHNGVDVSGTESGQLSAREEKRLNLLAELNLPYTAKLILSVGRLERRKGFLDVITAAPLVIREAPEVRFVFAGEGDLRAELESRIAASGLNDYFFLLGHRTDVPTLLDCCDLFLFPSHFEGFPFALMEALAHQIPYIASDTCGSKEIGLDGEYGLHFTCGSAQEMAEKVLQALISPGESVQRAARAKERVRDFSVSEMTAKTLRVIDSLCP